MKGGFTDLWAHMKPQRPTVSLYSAWLMAPKPRLTRRRTWGFMYTKAKWRIPPELNASFFLGCNYQKQLKMMHLITTRYEVLWESYQRYHAVSDIQYASLPQGYTAIALLLSDVSVPVVDWCFFCTDWLILLSKHWLTDNAVICSLGANHRPADTETHECIMKGDDGGDCLVLTQGRK